MTSYGVRSTLEVFVTRQRGAGYPFLQHACMPSEKTQTRETCHKIGKALRSTQSKGQFHECGALLGSSGIRRIQCTLIPLFRRLTSGDSDVEFGGSALNFASRWMFGRLKFNTSHSFVKWKSISGTFHVVHSFIVELTERRAVLAHDILVHVGSVSSDPSPRPSDNCSPVFPNEYGVRSTEYILTLFKAVKCDPPAWV
jgi:hypothetical protein